MTKARIINTFPDFLAYWEKTRGKSIEEQIDAWAESYLAPWSELLDKQLEDYSSQGINWRQVARERIFPRIDEHLPAMEIAQRNLLAGRTPIFQRAQEELSFDFQVTFVIYVGIGCGAGWATSFDQNPAILFGLENIAEEGWSEPKAIHGLVAHELGHLAHFHWREQNGIQEGSGPWWQLYTEGFAQWCEHRILGEGTWHMLSGQDESWLDWCQANLTWLAGDFLRRAQNEEPVRDFFGSWYAIQGHKQCGYFLGHELVTALVAKSSPKEVALLEDYELILREALEKMAE